MIVESRTTVRSYTEDTEKLAAYFDARPTVCISCASTPITTRFLLATRGRSSNRARENHETPVRITREGWWFRVWSSGEQSRGVDGRHRYRLAVDVGNPTAAGAEDPIGRPLHGHLNDRLAAVRTGVVQRVGRLEVAVVAHPSLRTARVGARGTMDLARERYVGRARRLCLERSNANMASSGSLGSHVSGVPAPGAFRRTPPASVLDR